MYSLILHGRRLVQLQKSLHLRVSLNPSAFSNPFSSITHRNGRKGKNFTVSYLVDSLGLTAKLAESISSKVSFEEKGNPDSVLNLLRIHGFTDSQISSIITDYPLLLIADAEKSIGPRLQFLISRGASSSELTEIVSAVPKTLGMKGDETIGRYYDFVKEIIEADKSSKFETLCQSLPQGNRQRNIIRNLAFLRELGVPQKRLFPLVISNHNVCSGKEKFDESLKKVIEMGFNPSTASFVLALRVVQGSSDKTIEEKMDVYESLGLDVGDVWEMFKKYPPSLGQSKKKILNSIETFLELGFSRDEIAMMVKCFPPCIGLSAETVKKKTEFLVKKMNWPLKTMTFFPQVLGYSLVKRTVPRCNVIKALMSKGLLGTQLPPMGSVMACTDQVFLKKFVMKLKDKQLVTELIDIFNGDCVSLK